MSRTNFAMRRPAHPVNVLHVDGSRIRVQTIPPLVARSARAHGVYQGQCRTGIPVSAHHTVWFAASTPTFESRGFNAQTEPGVFMKIRMAHANTLISAGVCALLVGCTSVTHQETQKDAQIDVLVASSRTKADELRIAAMYRNEAQAETEKARAAQNQAEAYRTHKDDFYSRRIYDLIEHSDALARHYREAAAHHNALANFHQDIANEMAP